MLIRPKRIYNLCLLHATFGRYCYDIHTLPYTFDNIWTNLLIQCTLVPVSVFGCFCISGFHVSRTAQKNPEKLYKKSAIRKQHCVRRAAWGGHQGSRRPGGAPPPGPRRGGAWAPRGSPDALLWHIFKGPSETLKKELLFAIPSLFRRRRRFQDREHQENSSRHPAGGEDHHRELLHHHGRLPDDS